MHSLGDVLSEGKTGGSIHIFWVAGMSCDGCSIALTGAANPSIERLLRGALPGLPRIVLHHPMLAFDSGSDFLEPFRRAARGELDDPYLLVVEGSATDDSRAGDGYWSALGSGSPTDATTGVVDGVRQPLRSMDWVRALAPGAVAAIAVGTCAAWGGVPAAAGNPMGAGSLADLLGPEYRSGSGLPVIAVPGCAPVGDNIVETIAAVLLHLTDLGPEPELDELGRPAWLFDETVHRRCVRAGFYEEGVFARAAGEHGCLVELGCWGAVVQCNITSRGAISGMGGCMNAGGACNGCTMPGFPDAFSHAIEPVSAAGGLQLLPVVQTSLAQPAMAEPASPTVWTFTEEPHSRAAARPGEAAAAVWRFWQQRGPNETAMAPPASEVHERTAGTR
ncbi:MAG TPA: hydrogenase expression protein HypE [Candidatus Dormibacteraeota bacterium]